MAPSSQKKRLTGENWKLAQERIGWDEMDGGSTLFCQNTCRTGIVFCLDLSFPSPLGHAVVAFLNNWQTLHSALPKAAAHSPKLWQNDTERSVVYIKWADERKMPIIFSANENEWANEKSRHRHFGLSHINQSHSLINNKMPNYYFPIYYFI